MTKKDPALGATFVTVLVASAIAWLVATIEVEAGFAVFGLNVAFVLPLGAFLIGLTIASGYYLLARLVQWRPQRWFGAIAAMVAVVSYGLTHYVIYLKLGGDLAQPGGGFWESYKHELRTSAFVLSRNGTSTGIERVGQWGYLLAPLHVLGYALGAFLPAVHLRWLRYCPSSQRYLTQIHKRIVWFGKDADESELALRVRTSFALDGIDETIEALTPSRPKKRHRRFRAVVTEHRCAHCGSGERRIRLLRNKRGEVPDVTAPLVRRFPSVAELLAID